MSNKNELVGLEGQELLVKIGTEYEEKGPTALARELGVSFQTVLNIAKKLRESGAKIGFVKKRGNYDFGAAAKEINKKI